MGEWPETQVPGLKKKLVQAISKKMQREGLSQGEVARRLEMDRRNVNKIFRESLNFQGISMDHLIKMANGIGLNVDLIIKKSSRN